MDDPDTWRQTNYLTASGVAVLTSDDDAPHHVVDEVSAGFTSHWFRVFVGYFWVQVLVYIMQLRCLVFICFTYEKWEHYIWVKQNCLLCFLAEKPGPVEQVETSLMFFVSLLFIFLWCFTPIILHLIGEGGRVLLQLRHSFSVPTDCHQFSSRWYLCSEKPICAPTLLSKVSPTSPLKSFQCLYQSNKH